MAVIVSMTLILTCPFDFQNVLQELQQKRPQLDDLLTTAETLKQDQSPEVDRKQLHGKGKKTF